MLPGIIVILSLFLLAVGGAAGVLYADVRYYRNEVERQEDLADVLAEQRDAYRDSMGHWISEAIAARKEARDWKSAFDGMRHNYKLLRERHASQQGQLDRILAVLTEDELPRTCEHACAGGCGCEEVPHEDQ